MDTLNTYNLYKRICSKGIKTNRGDSNIFDKYRYFQLINAYKALFVCDVKRIDDIENDINTNQSMHSYYANSYKVNKFSSSGDLFLKICKKICDKYGIEYESSRPKENINKITYIHHVYNKNTTVKDFVRIHKLETELRRILLSSVLEIEERLKNIFCNTLNNNKKPANYLLNLNNYNLSSISSIKSLQINIGKTANDYSKPMARKKQQKLIPPYWLIINDMTLGETIKTINNLDSTMKSEITKNIATKFIGKGSLSVKEIVDFMSIVEDLGIFRNTLAHNQPIFNFNVSQSDLVDFPIINYDKPKADDKRKKDAKVLAILANLKNIYGADTYNSRRTANLDLSYMVYVMCKIRSKIFDNDKFPVEISELFSRYGLFNIKTIYVSKNPEQINNAVNIIEANLQKINTKYLDDLINDIENGKAYKKKLKAFKRDLEAIKNVSLKHSQKAKYIPMQNEYKPFSFTKRYTQYTGIDSSFINNLI